MVKIKSSTEIDKAYKDSIARVPTKYKEGIMRTTDTIAKGIAAEGLYAERMQESIAAERRKKALELVSEADWQKKASTLGAERIGKGMLANADKRSKNYEPYRSALASLDLPDRTSDPMTNVTNRVGGVVKTLVDTKKSIKG